MKKSKNGLMNESLQKNQISSFEKSAYYLKSGRKLSLPMKHTLNELILYRFVQINTSFSLKKRTETYSQYIKLIRIDFIIF